MELFSCSCQPAYVAAANFVPITGRFHRATRKFCKVMAYSTESSSNFVKRMEKAWLISKQPRPVSCTSCKSLGHLDCKWCNGTGFFTLGDNMLCQVPSKNSACVVCGGKGSMCCPDCKGTGFRAMWLEDPPVN